MIKAHPYFNFNGKSEEAFNFYKSVFGGEFDSVMRFKDVPQSEQPMPESEANRIMHISLPIGNGIYLMASDISEARGNQLTEGNNMYIMIQPDTLDEAKRIYEQLSAGGTIEMPLEKMFWGDYFASFKDKYGVMWVVNIKA